MMHPDPQQTPGEENAPPDHGFWSHPNAITAAIVSVFVLLSLLVLVVMWGNYRESYHNVNVREAIAAGNFEQALPHAQALVNRSPESIMHLRRLANVQRETGRFDEAMANYDLIEEINPNLDLNAERASCLMEMGELDKAVPLLDRALAAKPNDPALNYYKGRLLLEQGRYREAAERLALTATSPLWNGRADALRNQIRQHVLGEAPYTTDTETP